MKLRINVKKALKICWISDIFFDISIFKETNVQWVELLKKETGVKRAIFFKISNKVKIGSVLKFWKFSYQGWWTGKSQRITKFYMKKLIIREGGQIFKGFIKVCLKCTQKCLKRSILTKFSQWFGLVLKYTKFELQGLP